MRWIPASVFLLLTVLHAGLATDSAGPADSAVKVFRGLQQRLRAARAAGDWPGSLSEAGELKEFLHDNPGALLEVARAAAHGSDRAPAWDALAQYVRMGQATDSLATSADFASLRDDPRFAEIEKSMKTNRSAVSAAAIAFVLPDAGLLAEDVDYDARRHRFLVTSVREKKIVAVQADGSLRDFARSPDGWPMLAVKVDGRRGVVWATAVAVQGSSMAPAADWGRSAVLCFESKSGKLLMRAEGPPGTALGDLALLHDGDVLASDGEGGGVYRLAAKAGSLVRLDKGDFLSPQTAAVSEDGKHVYVPDYERGIAEMDITTGHVRWLSGGGRLGVEWD